MARTTKVGLDVDEKPFVAGMGRAERAAGELAGSLDDVVESAKDTAATTARASDSVEGLGESARDAGQGVNSLRDDAAKLDRQIDESAQSVRDLARAIAAASDEADRAKLAEKLNAAQGTLRNQTSLRKLIDFTDIGDVKEEGIRYGARFAEGLASGLARAGGPISAALSSVFGGLPPQAQAAIGAGVIGAATAAAPAIAAVLSGAVVGAVGAGGIIGGVAVAAKHPQVKAAAKATGDTLKAELQRGAVSFVPATVSSLNIVRTEIGEISHDWERASSAASKMLVPLTRGVLLGAESAVDGFATAVERAGPVVDVLGDIAQDAGRLVGDVFEDLSENAYEGSRALAALWGVFAGGIRIVVGTIGALTEAYGWMEKLGALLVGNREQFTKLVIEEQNAKLSGDGLSEGLEELINGFEGTETAAAAATVEVVTFDQSVRDYVDTSLSARGANRELEASIDDATKALKENGRTLNDNSPKGRENAAALDRIAGAARTAYEKTLELNGSQDEANGKLIRGREAFLKHAEAMGMDAGKARILADALFAIPPSVTVTAKALTDKATGELIGFEKKIRQIDGRVITVRTRITSAGEYIPGVGTQVRRWGGVTEHARDGLLKDAAVYAPVSPARYAFAEPATGGEAFIPRFGNPDRSLDILSKAARWYGHAVVPAGGVAGAGSATSASGGGGTVNVNLSAYSNQFSLAQVMQDLAMRGAH